MPRAVHDDDMAGANARENGVLGERRRVHPRIRDVDGVGRGVPVARSDGGDATALHEQTIPQRQRAGHFAVASVRDLDRVDVSRDLVRPAAPDAVRSGMVDREERAETVRAGDEIADLAVLGADAEVYPLALVESPHAGMA